MDLSLITVTTIAWNKILLLLTFGLAFLTIWKFPRAWILSLLASLATGVSYAITSWPLQTMFWGGNGDETFIAGIFGQVLKGNPWNDFYYHNLPPFYPPLYFWLVGFFTKSWAANGIVAAKFGVIAILFFWFVGSYLVLKRYRHAVPGNDLITRSSWFFLFLPLIFFILLDFNDIVVKPYEALAALGMVCLSGILIESKD